MADKFLDTINSLTGSPGEVTRLQAIAQTLLDCVGHVVLGKRDVAELCLIALLAGEHVLLEDVPGVGKTLMGKALARSVNGVFRRVQFTPDLLPSDIVGSSILDNKTSSFVFNEGPVFSHFVLADEINRAPPRTQSALLEAMSDNQVSVDGVSHPLPRPFVVIATQNPFEFEGTYTLPESQLDRFLIRTSMGYPEREFEQALFKNHRDGEPVDKMESVCTKEDVLQMQALARDVVVDESIASYMLDIVHATRESPELSVGVSTRAVLSWYRAVQGKAFIDQRSYAIPDDAKSSAVPVLSHRVIRRGGLPGTQRAEMEQIVAEITASVAAPK